MVIKSAVAFFFLFFLHGTSIGNGQQGISYNVSQISEGTNSVGFSEEFGLLLMCCYTLFVLIFCAVGNN